MVGEHKSSGLHNVETVGAETKLCMVSIQVWITIGAETKLLRVSIRVQVYITVGAETALYMEGA